MVQVFDVTQGQIEFEVNRVDAEAKEIGGVFVSKQKGDTDMGSKVPKDILVKGELSFSFIRPSKHLFDVLSNGKLAIPPFNVIHALLLPPLSHVACMCV